jgi:general secretion pathway protein G
MKKTMGFTLIEVMVVLVIIGLMATLVAPQILGRQDKAMVIKAKTDMAGISSALKMYRLDNGFYPSTEQGLMALIVEPSTDPIPPSWSPKGYIQSTSVPMDPWNREYMYRSPGLNGGDFDVYSYGSDGREGGEDYAEDIIISG